MPAHAKVQVVSSGVLHIPVVIVKYLPRTKKSHKIPHIFNGYSHGDMLLKEIYIQHLSPTCLWYCNYYLIYILLSVPIAGSQQMENMYSGKHRKLQFYTYKLR